ncbi:hypothetical protein V5F23_20945 [Pseudomonas sp. WP18]|uniref:hypothetical protein n=1 Tax=Pseudomonas sp. WP18 TaxID=3118752 RepID=UPI0030D045CA
MAGSSTRPTAEQVRANYRKQLFKGGETLEFRAPIVVDAIPGDADGLIPISKIDAPLQIKIPEWPNRPDPGLPFFNKLYLDWKPASSSEFLEFHSEDVPDSGALPSDQFPLDRQIPLTIFESYEGTFQLRYRVKEWNSSTETLSFTAPITIDRTGPIRPDVPERIIILPQQPITTAILDQDGGVRCEIPDFTEDKKEFVTVAVAWLDKPPTSDMDPADLAYLGLLPPTRQILVPKDIVTRLGSKLHYVVYFLFDKAGNRSDMPFPVEVVVALGNLPTNLRAPSVPLAADNLIDWVDAGFPTKVEIGEYTNWDAYDGIVIRWGTTKLAETPVGSHLPFPLQITVPWTHIRDEYDFNGTNVQVTEVDYEVLRGPYPTASPGKIDVNVDLAIPGPGTGDPGPINPALELIRFKSHSNSDTELIEADIGEPASAFITLYDDPQVGDTLTLYWNGVAVSSPYIVDGSETPNQEVERIIPWSVIQQTPVMSQLPMYYTLTRTGFTNKPESRRTFVDVNVEVIDLEEPTFPDQDVPYPLNCEALVEQNGVWGIRVLIPPSVHVKKDVEVKAEWKTYDKSGSVELPNTDLKEDITVTEDQERDGIHWFIEYDKYLKPTYDTGDQYGYGKVKYTINIRGQDVSSDLVTVMIAVFENGGHCVIPRL